MVRREAEVKPLCENRNYYNAFDTSGRRYYIFIPYWLRGDQSVSNSLTQER